jgi:hypothetical protein
MNPYRTRWAISTAALMFFLGIAMHQGWEWNSLIIPGAVLVWVALVMPTPAVRIEAPKKTSR